MTLSTFKKRLVADIRGGDYTHPGKTEIIPKVMKEILLSTDNRIIDVGSGLGGTTKYLSRYGQVTGIDNDSDVIEYARIKYPDMQFIEADVHHLATTIPENLFDTAVLFSSFFSFENQTLACDSLAKICKPGSQLRLLDYCSPQLQFTNPFHANNLFKPVNKQNIKNILGQWEIESEEDITETFEEEYRDIINRLHSDQDRLTKTYSEEAYNKVLSSFNIILSSLQNGDLGGIIIYASLKK